MTDNDFMDYMGYREMLIDEKVNECKRLIDEGNTSINIDAGELEEHEIEEVKRRLNKLYK